MPFCLLLRFAVLVQHTNARHKMSPRDVPITATIYRRKCQQRSRAELRSVLIIDSLICVLSCEKYRLDQNVIAGVTL